MRQFNASNRSAIEFSRKTYRYPFQMPVESYYTLLDVFTRLVTISQNIHMCFKIDVQLLFYSHIKNEKVRYRQAKSYNVFIFNIVYVGITYSTFYINPFSLEKFLEIRRYYTFFLGKFNKQPFGHCNTSYSYYSQVNPRILCGRYPYV